MTTMLRLKAVQARTGLSRSTIYTKISTGEFPKPIKLSERAIGFVEAEIEEFNVKQIAASRTPAAKPPRGKHKAA
jgi:prophage regulatory protein